MMVRLKLTVDEEKTRRCRIPQEHFDFLGYTFGRCYSTKTGRADIGTRPARKRIRKVCRTISEATRRRRRWLGKKHHQSGRGTTRYPDEHLYGVFGLQRLLGRRRNPPWAKA